jgi:hypothetical protein
MASQIRDALLFTKNLPQWLAVPNVWTDGADEVVLEWIDPSRHAVVSFEGDSTFGYAIRVGNKFRPGSHPGRLDLPAPEDLVKYVGAK